MVGEFEPDLSAAEKRLLCGDPRTPGWSIIPESQAAYHFGIFLQQRGFHQPVFTRLAPGLRVEVGARTRITSVLAEGVPEDVDLSRRRKVIGEPLTPGMLDSLEQWTYERVQAAGYPCPLVTSQGDPSSGVVRVIAEPGPRLRLLRVDSESVPGIDPGILRRYDAFREGELFNGDLLSVTERRIGAENLIQSTHFSPHCAPEGVVVSQSNVAGPPRLLAVGAGADTEGFLRARVSWRNARLGNRASWLEFAATGSSREQALRAVLDWYPLPFPSRRHVRPSLTFRHRNETFYEYLSARQQLGFATTWDGASLGSSFLVGPSFDRVRTIQGPGPEVAQFLSLDALIQLRSHSFELFSANPRTGFEAGITTSLATRNFVSTATAQRVALDGVALWNIQGWDPPLFVLGIRGLIATTFSQERPGVGTLLPVTCLNFLGGSADLRGFARQELPDSFGALTAGYLGSEFRWVASLPLGLEPLAFLDIGKMGRAPRSWDPPLFWSPGAGLRWASPVGPFRATLARGYVDSAPRGWQFYFSYGEEF